MIDIQNLTECVCEECVCNIVIENGAHKLNICTYCRYNHDCNPNSLKWNDNKNERNKLLPTL